MPAVFIGLGSNLGDRENYIIKAIDCLRKTPGITVEKISTIIETDPWEAAGQDRYLNAVVKIDTDLPARDLFKLVQAIENSLGRTRPSKNAPRTIDLDILLYGEEHIDVPGLTVPHPRMFEREFVIKPLLEIEPEFKDRLIRYDCNRKR